MEHMRSFETIEMLNSVIQDVKDSSIELAQQLSNYDLQQQDILHFIENSRLNAVQISKLWKMLKSIRTSRRNIKNELHRYQSLASKLSNGSNLLATIITSRKEEDYYEFKTNILSEDFGFGVGSKMYFDDIKKVEFTTDVKDESVVPIATPEYVKGAIETVTLKEPDEDKFDDALTEAILDHPEGRGIVLTSNSTKKSFECRNFETAVMKAIGGSLASKLKPSELVKNVSGAMKAIKFGTDYLGYKWEVQ